MADKSEESNSNALPEMYVSPPFWAAVAGDPSDLVYSEQASAPPWTWKQHPTPMRHILRPALMIR